MDAASPDIASSEAGVATDTRGEEDIMRFPEKRKNRRMALNEHLLSTQTSRQYILLIME